MISNILTCCDCLNSFCQICDDDFSHCPDCGEALCGECTSLALDMRQTRCTGCADDDLTKVRYPYENEDRKLYKHYTTPRSGQLD